MELLVKLTLLIETGVLQAQSLKMGVQQGALLMPLLFHSSPEKTLSPSLSLFLQH